MQSLVFCDVSNVLDAISLKGLALCILIQEKHNFCHIMHSITFSVGWLNI